MWTRLREQYSRVVVLLGLIAVMITGSVAAEDNLTGITPQQHQQIGWMEEALLGSTYPSLSPDKRLDELEETILGHSNPQQSIAQRISTLDKALLARKKSVEMASRTALNQENTNGMASSPQQTFSSGFDPRQTAYSNSTSSPALANQSVRQDSVDGMADNLILERMEQQVFHRTYPGEPIQSRLTRLELSVMGYQQTGHLSARTDNLRWLVFGASQQPDALTRSDVPEHQVASQPMQPPSHYLPDPASQQNAIASAAPIQGQPGNVYTGQYGQSQGVSQASVADMQRALTTIEKQELRTSYPTDPIPARLARLEHKIFNQTADHSGYSDEERLQRIIAVSAAEKDSVAAGRGPSGGIKSMWPLIPILVLMLL